MSDETTLPLRIVTLKETGELSITTPEPSAKLKLRDKMSAQEIRDLVRRKREELVAES